MALRYEPGPVAELAHQAFFEVMNPKAGGEAVPESPKAAKQQSAPGGPPAGFGGGAGVPR
jgi:hypothetical protein